MWTRHVVWVAVVVALASACGSEDEGNNNPAGAGGTGGSGGGAGAMAATGGTMATGGTSGAGGMGGGMGGSGGFSLPECDMVAGPAMCGANACGTVAFGPTCNKTCCTTDMKCGLSSAINPTCIEVMDPMMCQPAMILGQMTPACCIVAENRCGVVNTLTGNPPCYAREDVPLASLEPANCDGTPVMTTGGTGGMGTGGMGSGGMGADDAGTADAGL